MPEMVDPGRWAPFVHAWTMLLTSYKRDGTGVDTPVNVAVEGDHAFFRTFDKAGKTRRLALNSVVDLAPSTVRGKPKGPAVRATARLLEGDEDRHAATVIGKKYPIFQKRLVRLTHRLARYHTMHYELRLTDS